MLVGVAWVAVLAGCGGGSAPEGAASPGPSASTVGEAREGKAGRRGREEGGAARGRGGPERQSDGPLPDWPDPCAEKPAPGLYDFELPFGGEGTSTVVYVPKGAGPHPMVVALHGGEGDSDSILDQTGILRIADERGLVVVAPTGAGGAPDGKENWNTHDAPGMKRDDVRYLDALSRALERRTCSDRVVAVGFSNGAMMANRWLCEGEEPAAALTAAGRIGVDTSKCRGPRPHRNYVGSDDDQYRTGTPNTAQTMDLWAQINRCEGPPKETTDGRLTRRVWSGCAAPVEQTVIAGFPHAWPKPGARAGSPVDATVEGWAWIADALASGR